MGKFFIKERARHNKLPSKQSSKYICACLIYLHNSLCANYSIAPRGRTLCAATGRAHSIARAAKPKLIAHTLLSKLFVREIIYFINNIFAFVFRMLLRSARAIIKNFSARLSK